LPPSKPSPSLLVVEQRLALDRAVSSEDAGFYQVTGQSRGRRRETGPAKGISPALPWVIPPPPALSFVSRTERASLAATLHSFARAAV